MEARLAGELPRRALLRGLRLASPGHHQALFCVWSRLLLPVSLLSYEHSVHHHIHCPIEALSCFRRSVFHRNTTQISSSSRWRPSVSSFLDATQLGMEDIIFAHLDPDPITPVFFFVADHRKESLVLAIRYYCPDVFRSSTQSQPYYLLHYQACSSSFMILHVLHQ